MGDRFDRVRHIQTLDPERDFESIYRMMVQYEFVSEFRLAFYLAFIRPFGLPGISRITAATGEITERMRKRTTDTAILLYTIFEFGFRHELGRDAIRRLNQIHRPWRAARYADDYRYVIGTLLIPPMRFLDTYAWRRPSEHERRSAYLFYRTLGGHMNVSVPSDYDSFVTWFDEYERRQLAFDPANAALMSAAHATMAKRLPPLLRWPVNRGIDSLLEDPVRRAIGIARPPWIVRAGTGALLRMSARRARRGPARTEPAFTFGTPMFGYPNGYTLDDVGPSRPGPGR